MSTQLCPVQKSKQTLMHTMIGLGASFPDFRKTAVVSLQKGNEFKELEVLQVWIGLDRSLAQRINL